MDFSTDGSLVAAGVIDGTVRLFDVESGKIVKNRKYGGETDIHHVVFSPDGRYLATGGRVPAVILWDVASGKVVKTFRLTDNAISMDFSPDGTILATAGGSEYEVRLWDVESGDLLYSLPHNDQLTSIAFSPDGDCWLLDAMTVAYIYMRSKRIPRCISLILSSVRRKIRQVANAEIVAAGRCAKASFLLYSGG